MSHSTVTIPDKEETGHPYDHFPLQASQLENAHAQPLLQAEGTAALRPVQFRPIVISSFCFAAVHFPHGVAPIPLFFFALALGYLYQRTHRLLAPVVLHMCLNACSMLFLWLETRGG
jgi:hypothetical protein